MKLTQRLNIRAIVGEHFDDMEFENNPLKLVPKAQATTTKKMNEEGSINIENVNAPKHQSRVEQGRGSTEWKKVFAFADI